MLKWYLYVTSYYYFDENLEDKEDQNRNILPTKKKIFQFYQNRNVPTSSTTRGEWYSKWWCNSFTSTYLFKYLIIFLLGKLHLLHSNFSVKLQQQWIKLKFSPRGQTNYFFFLVKKYNKLQIFRTRIQKTKILINYHDFYNIDHIKQFRKCFVGRKGDM